ncbi:kinase-like domain-containing protein [Boletus coccyginus]|nr:kinase-like domain-containing protein [Boletus coccyginus]
MSTQCRSLRDALATLPNLSDKILKSDEQYCEAGGFSDVYKRKFNDGDGLVEVAVKSFRFPFTVDETENKEYDSRSAAVRKMLRRELGIWRRLKHPNVVPFLGITYGFGRQGNASLVSVWMANGSLQSFLREHNDRLDTAHRLQLLLDIASGLCYLHSFPVVHGDLSCNNVLLDHNYNACLTDFGFASMVGDIPEALAYLQMTTMQPGTLRWAAPEHFAVDAEETTQRTTKSDIYSFGNLGLLVLSGKHPWSEIKRDALVTLQLSQGKKPERPSSRPIEDKHWELIEHCWSSVDKRPCATDVVSALQQFLHSCPAFPPLLEIFRLPSHSDIVLREPVLVVSTPIRAVKQNIGAMDINTQHPGLPEATIDHRSAVFQDDSVNAATTHDIHRSAIRQASRRLIVIPSTQP